MSNPPRTPSDWLTFLAEIAKTHPLTTFTPAGADLQHAFEDFLLKAGASGANPEDLRADLLILLPRLCNAIIQSEHEGGACGACAGNFGFQLYNEIARHMNEISHRQKTGGLH
ncbi:hypothetical protein Rleg9DRAFT_1754 [Rhizobium leguminosarum bv. trifolii WSM597]|uniref:Uncharacterized protein n=1 Tax=Rhizobium leguminosarum bv. trifolii WSM597 TaxID=754764 RepID=I9N4X0_RHILT|nr:hypothetical protein [Rhizobium leguminosarum]EJB02939.1 hypothetical protein Rleg9DRAFT_1754 [Rhizobium leguminosarum bv. trifolii WSM597]